NRLKTAFFRSLFPRLAPSFTSVAPSLEPSATMLSFHILNLLSRGPHGRNSTLSRLPLRHETRRIERRPHAALRQNHPGDAGEVLRRESLQPDSGGKRARAPRRHAAVERIHARRTRNREVDRRKN